MTAAKYKQAATHAANSPNGVLRTSATFQRFKGCLQTLAKAVIALWQEHHLTGSHGRGRRLSGYTGCKSLPWPQYAPSVARKSAPAAMCPCKMMFSIHGWTITASGFGKWKSAILEFYFRFRFWPNQRHRHGIGHRRTKLHPNTSAYCRVMMSCRFFKMAAIASQIYFRLPV